MMSNAYLLEKFGFDTAENEPAQKNPMDATLAEVPGLRRRRRLRLLRGPEAPPGVHLVPRAALHTGPGVPPGFSLYFFFNC